MMEAGDFVKGNRIEVIGTKHFLGKHGVVVDVAFELRPGRVAVQLDDTNGALAIKATLLAHEDPNWLGSEDVSVETTTTTMTQPSHASTHDHSKRDPTPEPRNDTQPTRHCDKPLEHDSEEQIEEEQTSSTDPTILTPNVSTPYSQTQPLQNQIEPQSTPQHAHPGATTPATATSFPVSVDGTCPTCRSNYVQHLVLLGVEDKDGAPSANLGPTVTKLLEMGWAATCRPTPEIPEPSSFLCYGCGFGFNVDWTRTTLETIFWHVLTGSTNNYDDGSGNGYNGGYSTHFQTDTTAHTPHPPHPAQELDQGGWQYETTPHIDVASSTPAKAMDVPENMSAEEYYSRERTQWDLTQQYWFAQSKVSQAEVEERSTALDALLNKIAKPTHVHTDTATNTDAMMVAYNNTNTQGSTALDNTIANDDVDTDTLIVTHGNSATDRREYVGGGGGTNSEWEPNKYVTNFKKYTATANFTNFGGRFAAHSHEERWEKKNIPKERDMRFLAHFMDPAQLTSSDTRNEDGALKPNSKPKKLTKAEIKHFKDQKKKRQRQKATAFLRS
eukprot:m.167672 g.167672  ORF g.167672 m.167672 type:complete len:556 (-) comp31470_c0_seq2:118-1785(-)